jgi:hypothetical protein
MYYNLQVQVTTQGMTKPYNPTKLEIWVGATVEGITTLQTKTTENLPNGIRTEERTFQFPASQLSSLLGGYDFNAGQPSLIITALNQFIAQFDLEVIS